MNELRCPACGGLEWVPVVRLFLDVGLGRPPCPLTLERSPEDIWYRCLNDCVGVTGQGDIVGLGVRRQPRDQTGAANQPPKVTHQ
jgi:hypothetical protein